ncbi:MAG TPA: hypothetical protein VN513_04100 [Gemmatimonadales bacterium]|nr:hypothetical protein [Gemmatimonadales bacterium]
MSLLTALSLTTQPLNRVAAQQVASNRATAYLFPTEVQDARAIWVNPAGLGVLREASIYAELLVGDPGSDGQLRQINAGFNARGLSVAYQRDNLDGDVNGHTLRLGLAGGSGGLAAGFAVALYRGTNAHATGWDVGFTYVPHPKLSVGLVGANIGQPVVRGLQQIMTYIPGLTWRTPAKGVSLSADTRITTDSVASYAFGLSWHGSGGGRWPLELIARLDTDGDFRRGAFVFGVSLGSQDRFGAIGTTPGDVSRVDGVSMYGLASREQQARQR